MSNWLYRVAIKNKAGEERTIDFVAESPDSARAALSASVLAQMWTITDIRPTEGDFGVPVSVEHRSLEELMSIVEGLARLSAIDERLARIERKTSISGTKVAFAVCVGLWLYAISIILFWIAIVLLMGGSVWGIGRAISP